LEFWKRVGANLNYYRSRIQKVLAARLSGLNKIRVYVNRPTLIVTRTRRGIMDIHGEVVCVVPDGRAV